MTITNDEEDNNNYDTMPSSKVISNYDKII